MDGTSIFKLVFGEQKPAYAWQSRFAADEWPDVLIAPTGSGKTAGVTLGWVSHRMRDPENTPRRLVWCLPMRTLVDQTKREAEEWFGRLKEASIDKNHLLPLRCSTSLSALKQAAPWASSVRGRAVRTPPPDTRAKIL